MRGFVAWLGSAHFCLGIRSQLFFFFNGTEPACSYRPPLLVPTDSSQAGLRQDSAFLNVLANQDLALDAQPFCPEP
ncbi:hypothetical protein LZ31DRAFT_560949 [Colletotrichum somersetense]|nr:hypothetical protein LZ31DRAFT_560949 [Colletotrichum somersetense]